VLVNAGIMAVRPIVMFYETSRYSFLLSAIIVLPLLKVSWFYSLSARNVLLVLGGVLSLSIDAAALEALEIVGTVSFSLFIYGHETGKASS
jgi:hypothetical protein